jgi:uncharacterized protein with HEPN domain
LEIKNHRYLQAVQDIEQFTQEMTFEEFRKNKMVVQSVLYNFVIIGEASANIPDEIQGSIDFTMLSKIGFNDFSAFVDTQTT